MNPIPVEKNRLSELATMIVNDIRKRGLRPGDRYFNGQELADLCGTSLMTANRAMQLLAKRNVLERRQRAGTFIGAAADTIKGLEQIKCVHLLMPDSYFRVYRAQLELSVTGLHGELPESAIQYTFLPADGALPFVRRLVEQAAATQSIEGVVLYISPPEVQSFFDQAGIPAVVFGSVYPDVSSLPWVDRDQHQIGRLLAEHLLAKGHQTALLMRDRWGYGDNLMIDGVQEVFSKAKGSGRSLTIRSVPATSELANGTVRMLLADKNRPTALICRSQSLANVAAEVAGDLLLKLPKDLEIAVCDPVLGGDGGDPRFTVAQPQVGQEEQGAMLARFLKTLAAGQRLEPDHILIPVQLRTAQARRD
jgi:DNA-binding LacI/PurR family transcriptional regulator